MSYQETSGMWVFHTVILFLIKLKSFFSQHNISLFVKFCITPKLYIGYFFGLKKNNVQKTKKQKVDDKKNVFHRFDNFSLFMWIISFKRLVKL